MSLNVFATALVVPPLAAIPLTLAGVALGWRWRRAGLVLVAIGAALLLVLAMPAVAGILLASTEQGLPLTPQSGDPPQAIVILGGGAVHAAGPNGYGVEPLTLERLAAGAALYRRVHLPILVTGGRPATGGGPPIAARMATVLERDFGVPVRWQETLSMSTWQNAEFSSAILMHQGVHSIYLVTHAWHMRRAVFCFRHFEAAVTAAPVRIDRVPAPILANFAPSVTAWADSYYALHEWIGLVWYHLRY
jgi:uncharacterized SAM-binding protein YcdF (DUF218 family)